MRQRFAGLAGFAAAAAVFAALGGVAILFVALTRAAPIVETASERWLEVGIIVWWFGLAALALTAGLLRTRFRWRRRIERMGLFGSGISDELVRRLLARQRAGG